MTAIDFDVNIVNVGHKCHSDNSSFITEYICMQIFVLKYNVGQNTNDKLLWPI